MTLSSNSDFNFVRSVLSIYFCLFTFYVLDSVWLFLIDNAFYWSIERALNFFFFFFSLWGSSFIWGP
jgi:hypothetical protein